VSGVDPLEPPVVLTVSELVLRASDALVAEFGTIAVEGEISSFHHHSASGHMYWTLKDRSSEVRCVMFRRDNRRLRFDLEDGVDVVVVARPTIYRARGQFQLEIADVRPRGRGALWLQFEELKRKLAAEGLFAEERKRRLPWWPRTVGVVTSEAGAAVRDICSVIHRRAPGTRILLKPVPVQGRDAAPEIARAVRWFSERGEVDVLIVGRGGGSLEDLWAFNEEEVVRAIAACTVPVVSAVGHETDTTLADYAGDLRAPTPSAAAERVVPETREIERTVVASFQRLVRAVERQRARRLEEALAPIRRYGFRRVRDRLHEQRQRWAEGVEALPTIVAARNDATLLALSERAGALPAPVAERHVACLTRLGQADALPRETARRIDRARERHRHLSERLRAASPLAILARGYAVVTDAEGRVVTDAGRLAPDDPVSIRLARGAARAEITEVEPHTNQEVR